MRHARWRIATKAVNSRLKPIPISMTSKLPVEIGNDRLEPGGKQELNGRLEERPDDFASTHAIGQVLDRFVNSIGHIGRAASDARPRAIDKFPTSRFAVFAECGRR